MNAIGWAALAAGAAVLLPKPPKHNLMKLPSFRGVAEVRSSLPGRMRLYVPAVTQEPALTGQMVQQMESTGVIHQVKAEPRTGSVLICYDESKVQAPVVLGAMMKLMGLDGKVRPRQQGAGRDQAAAERCRSGDSGRDGRSAGREDADRWRADRGCPAQQDEIRLGRAGSHDAAVVGLQAVWSAKQ